MHESQRLKLGLKLRDVVVINAYIETLYNVLTERYNKYATKTGKTPVPKHEGDYDYTIFPCKVTHFFTGTHYKSYDQTIRD